MGIAVLWNRSLSLFKFTLRTVVSAAEQNIIFSLPVGDLSYLPLRQYPHMGHKIHNWNLFFKIFLYILHMFPVTAEQMVVFRMHLQNRVKPQRRIHKNIDGHSLMLIPYLDHILTSDSQPVKADHAVYLIQQEPLKPLIFLKRAVFQHADLSQIQHENFTSLFLQFVPQLVCKKVKRLYTRIKQDNPGTIGFLTF